MLAIKYTTFAIFATAINLAFQYLSMQVCSGVFELYIAILVGTIVGLVTKYILDKKWIFYHIPRDKKDDAKKFIRYSFMGVLTTCIFWGTELAFAHFFTYPFAMYVGAIVGLSIGYVIKYYLDKKYVFIYLQ